MPDNVFPFARLASVTTLDASFTYLYHQMNGTTFAEEEGVKGSTRLPGICWRF